MFYVGRSKLRILVDPLSVHLDASRELIHKQVALTTILQYLSGIAENKVDIEILFPEFLWDNKWKENYESFVPGDVDLYEPKKLIRIKQQKVIESDWAKQRVRETKEYLETKKAEYLKFPKITLQDPKSFIRCLENGTLLDYRDAEYIYKYGYLELIDLYFQYRCDLLLTCNRILVKEKQPLADKYRLFTTYYPEVFDKVETFLKGHNIYISTQNPIYGLDAGSFYPITDLKLRKYFQLWDTFVEIKKDPEMSEYLRVMFYHRYSFMKYSIDQIKFHLLLAERLEDEKLRFRHYFLISYHLNAFYLNVWGFLDNLAWVLNYLYGLGFTKKEPIKITFSNKEYRKKLQSIAPKVFSILEDSETKKWMENLTLKRQPAAHREPLFMSPLYDQQTMNLISEKMIAVNTKEGREIFEAVNHFNYDIEQFEKFLDKLLFLFIPNK
ncbi:MAG: hypothetical protein Q7R31_01465 [Candidatus Levybacteria bacterium]|nr:hypothetical protein [Candidatus Levybacteria bacterium]